MDLQYAALALRALHSQLKMSSLPGRLEDTRTGVLACKAGGP